MRASLLPLSLAAAVCVSPGIHAQAVIQADGATMQPQVYRDGPTITGCGQRIVLMSVVSPDLAYVADFSISVRGDLEKSSLWGLTKAGIYKTDPRKGVAAIGASTTVPITSYFISSQDGSVTLAPDKFLKAETAGFLLGGSETGDSTDLMMRMLTGERTQFGIRLRAEPVTRVYSFTVTTSDNDRADFQACIDAFIKVMNKHFSDQEGKGD